MKINRTVNENITICGTYCFVLPQYIGYLPDFVKIHDLGKTVPLSISVIWAVFIPDADYFGNESQIDINPSLFHNGSPSNDRVL